MVGASGRMGQAIVRLASEMNDTEIVGLVSLGDSLESLASSGANVVIDFSSPAGTRAIAPVCAGVNIAIVSGTTGLDDAAEKALDDAAKSVPVFWAPNMSVGVHVLATVVAEAVRMLGTDYDPEIVEAHHRRKVDAPSGTALRLAEAVREGRGKAVELEHGRSGQIGPRKDVIGMHAVRGGGVVGDHTVFLLGESERLELTHRAQSREVFASGAIRAAQWIIGKAPRRYAMADMFAS